MGIEQIKQTDLEKFVSGFKKSIFIFGGISILCFMYFLFLDEEKRIMSLVFGGVFGGMSILSVIGLIVYRKKNRLQKEHFAEMRELRIQRSSEERLVKLLLETDELVDESRRERLGTRKKSLSLVTRREYNLTIYDGEVQNEKCSICKLNLRKKQQIVQCNKCLNLFHKKHLEDWLEKKDSCPVCNENIVDIVAIV